MLPLSIDPLARAAGAVTRRAVVVCAALASAVPASGETARSYASVEVRGAEFIPEDDIRNTCGVLPNVPYLTLELRAIEECLMSTGVFERVALRPEGDSLVIEVVEWNTRPGRIEASLSYGSRDGLIGGLFFERYNLFPDTYGAVRLEYNAEVQRGQAQLYHVDLIGDDLDLGFRVGWEELDLEDRSYSEKTAQIESYLAWVPRETLRLEAGLGYRDFRLFDVEAGASSLLQVERGDGIDAPFLRLGLDYRSATPPAEAWGEWGYSFGLDQYLWNLGTEETLSDFRLATRSYVPLGSNLRMLIALDAGTVSGLDGNATRILDRFAPGGSSFRGFAPAGVGPRDNGDGLGGNNFAVSSIEVQHNFKDLVDAPLVGGVFWQTGAAWGLDDTQGGAIDDGYHQRSSVGLSLSFTVGSAPVSVYLAKPIEKEQGDAEQVFGLSLTRSF